MSGPNPENEGVLLGVARVLGLPDGAALASLRPSGLWKITQRELLDVARLLGLTKVSRLNKQALLARVWETLERMGAIAPNGGTESMPGSVQAGAARRPRVTTARMATGREAEGMGLRSVPLSAPASEPAPDEAPETPAPPETSETPPDAAHKFDMGQAPDRDPDRVRALAEAHIPWSYGRDRVTAMPVDPGPALRLLGGDRRGHRPGRAPAWGPEAPTPGCRCGSTTSPAASSTAPTPTATSTTASSAATGSGSSTSASPPRTWSSTSGLKSHEGYFAKIARSGRVEFPRREPVPWSEPEWMTVRVSSGEIAGSSHGMPGGGGAGTEVAAAAGPGPGPGGWEAFGQDVIGGIRRRMWEGRRRRPGGEVEERTAWEEGGWTELTPEVSYGWSWEGDREVVSWVAGPFSYPVEAPALVRESYAGTARTFRANGRTHVVWGPWQVVIRGVGAHAEQEVLARWEVYRSWTSSGWREVNRGPGEAMSAGSSELMTRRQRALGPDRQRGAAHGRLRAVRLGASDADAGGQRALVPGVQRMAAARGERAALARRQRVALPGRQRAAAPGGERAALRGGQRAAPGGGQRAPARWGQRAAGRSQRAAGRSGRAGWRQRWAEREEASPTTSTARPGHSWSRTNGAEEAAMATGYFSLVLHAHLPFVRHPEDPTVMEERWLQEAIPGPTCLSCRPSRGWPPTTSPSAARSPCRRRSSRC